MHTFKKRCLIPKYLNPNLFRRLFCLFLTAAFCLTLDFTALAEVKIEIPKQTVYLNSSDIGTSDAEVDIDFYIRLSGGDSINKSSIRSDNAWTAGSIGYYSHEWKDGFYFLCVRPRYPGTANILFENQSGRIYTVTAKVLPYENPINSFKITNINGGKNLAKKADRSNNYTLEKLIFSKQTAAPKLTVKAAKDWKITFISICAEKAKGGNAYNLHIEDIHAQAKTVKLKKAAKGDKIDVDISLKNTKNGAKQYIHFGNLYS